jgi:hypothetical protein
MTRCLDVQGCSSEATSLAYWLVRHPSAKAQRKVEELLGNAFEERYWLPYALARMGDPRPLQWARQRLDDPNAQRWIPLRIVAMSAGGGELGRIAPRRPSDGSRYSASVG